jgi:hypothetical protein
MIIHHKKVKWKCEMELMIFCLIYSLKYIIIVLLYIFINYIF